MFPANANSVKLKKNCGRPGQVRQTHSCINGARSITWGKWRRRRTGDSATTEFCGQIMFEAQDRCGWKSPL
jgi:hypothetical protein